MAIPWSVLDCPAYARLSHPARSLLLEIARQFVRDNNGRLLTSLRHLESRGWKSWDVITRAKRELLESGFIHETVMGHRPNKASWYALTWRALDKIPGFDPGAEASFERGAYMKKIDVLTPSHGAGMPVIAPPDGAGDPPTAPPDGAIRAVLPLPPAPSHGDHLEKPSTVVCLSAGIPDVRLPASLTLIGRVLHRARPANRPAGYAVARSRFPFGVNHD
ncbi:MAG TPA: hypothetical protein PLB25_03055 [Rhodoferax sp.]|nr:hypothetical protein [Rhodoferax sp.]